MCSLVRLAAISALAALVATPVLAQESGLGLGVAAGANLPSADFGDAAKTGVVVNGFVEWRTGGPLGVRGSLFWSRSDIDNPIIKDIDGATLPDDSNLDVSGNVDLVGASLDLTLGKRQGTIQPYLVGGVGVFRRRVSQDVEGAVEEFKDLRDKDTEVGYNGGAGLRFALGGLSLYAEGRYYSVQTDPDNTNFIPVVIGIEF